MSWVSEVKVLKSVGGKQLLPYPIEINAYYVGDEPSSKYNEIRVLITISEADNLLSKLQAAVDEARSV